MINASFLFSHAAEGAADAASVTNTFISSLRSFAASDSPFFHSLFRSLTDFDFGGRRFDAAPSKDFSFSPIRDRGANQASISPCLFSTLYKFCLSDLAKHVLSMHLRFVPRPVGKEKHRPG